MGSFGNWVILPPLKRKKAASSRLFPIQEQPLTEWSDGARPPRFLWQSQIEHAVAVFRSRGGLVDFGSQAERARGCFFRASLSTTRLERAVTLRLPI
jgi:hypothetical protein